MLLLSEPDELRGDARVNLERLAGAATRAVPFAARRCNTPRRRSSDAILGTGFSGEAREPVAAAIEAINAAAAAGASVVACDVPSGVDASTGEARGAAGRADATVTFHAAKPGLWISPGKSLSGDVHVIEIGIPAGGPVEPTVGLIRPAVLDGVPRRGRDSTKFAAGSVLVCGGSTGLTGAPSMAAEAAMRTGAGYVTALVPASLNLVFEVRLLEVMSVPLPDTDGALGPDATDTVLERCERADALILGPGIGRADATAELARLVARRAPVPLLLDADGLNAHAGELGTLAKSSAPATVLTPRTPRRARASCSGAERRGRRHGA